MAFLAAAIPYIAAASTVISTVGAIKQGQDQAFQAQQQAAALRNQANADEAAAQRTAQNTRRQTDYVMSRARAIAASSGAGASDPTVVNVEGEIAGQGEYNALTSLYEGSTAGGNARSQATAVYNEGQAAKSAGYLRGATTLLSGGTTLYTKYK